MATIKKHLWLILLALGFIGFLLVFFFLPRRSLIDAAWHMFIKIFIFIIITGGIAFFPNKFKLKFLLLLLPLIVYIGFIAPRISYLGNVGIPSHFEGQLPNAYDEFYTYLYLILFPFIISYFTFAYRLGGGKPWEVIKLSLSGVILLFAGTLDIMYHIVNPVNIPEKLQYANHIKVILGHYPNFGETVVFALCHIPLLVILWLLPLKKWLKKFPGDEYL